MNCSVTVNKLQCCGNLAHLGQHKMCKDLSFVPNYLSNIQHRSWCQSTQSLSNSTVLESFNELIILILGIRDRFVPWEPSSTEVELLNKNPKRRKVTGNSTIGEFIVYHAMFHTNIQKA